MRCNRLKAEISGEGFNMAIEMATDATDPVEMVNQIRRVLQTNGFQRPVWTTISFQERVMEADKIVRVIDILGRVARMIDK